MYVLRTWTWDAKPGESTPIEPVKVRHPTKSAIIVNRNIDSKVAEQICENEESKVNTIKWLVSGNLSLSWNEGNKIEL